MALFDSHCHLQDERLASDIEGVMRRAEQAGVARLCCCGSSPTDWPEVEKVAFRFPIVLPAFGVHPWHLAERDPEWLETLRALLVAHPEAPVGEIGLDHAIAADRTEQVAAFRAQLELAAELKRPVSLHVRRAWDSVLGILREIPRLPPALLFHAYSGGAELLPQLLSLNGYVSFCGSITRSGNRRGRATALAIPTDRMLVESDAPDLAPVQVPPATPNEPSFLRHTVEALSQIRGLAFEETAALTWTNTCRALRVAP